MPATNDVIVAPACETATFMAPMKTGPPTRARTASLAICWFVGFGGRGPRPPSATTAASPAVASNPRHVVAASGAKDRSTNAVAT